MNKHLRMESEFQALDVILIFCIITNAGCENLLQETNCDDRY